MQYLVQNVDRTFGRIPRHALGVAGAVAFAVIATRIAAERRRKPRTRVTPIAGWRTPAEAIRTAVAVCEGVSATTPADPDPTLPLTRAEVIEVDGGRPLNDLDYVQRQCHHADSMHGRCADCGTTWAAQAATTGGAQ